MRSVVVAIDSLLIVSVVEILGALVVRSLALFRMLLSNGLSVLNESAVLGVVVNLGLKNGLMDGLPRGFFEVCSTPSASIETVVDFSVLRSRLAGVGLTLKNGLRFGNSSDNFPLNLDRDLDVGVADVNVVEVVAGVVLGSGSSVVSSSGSVTFCSSVTVEVVDAVVL